jgi:hypothetical protein
MTHYVEDVIEPGETRLRVEAGETVETVEINAVEGLRSITVEVNVDELLAALATARSAHAVFV